MAMPVKDVKEWLNTLKDDELIGIDEGGLCLTTHPGDEGKLGEAYLEIGMILSSEDVDPC